MEKDLKKKGIEEPQQNNWKEKEGKRGAGNKDYTQNTTSDFKLNNSKFDSLNSNHPSITYSNWSIKRDRIFKKPLEKQFEFDEKVASVFDDMITRSVPYYRESMELQLDYLIPFLKPGDRVVDLGCSTGTFLLELESRLSIDLDLIGIDNSSPMIARATAKGIGMGSRVQFLQSDILQYQLKKCKGIVANYTLQFIRPLYRQQVVEKIFAGLVEGGVFLFTEKLISPNPKLHKIMVDIYHRYKENRGYSRYEIAQKREALENVLIPYTMEENLELIKRVGFKWVEVIFRWNNFATFIALKE